jgi:hypothetical protein
MDASPSDWQGATSAPVNGSRSPQNWTPRGNIAVPAGSGYGGVPAVQLFGPRVGRQSIMVTNTGANAIQIADAANFQGTGFTVAAGGVFVFDNEGAVYAYNVAGGSTVDTIETWFNISGASRGQLSYYRPGFQ